MFWTVTMSLLAGLGTAAKLFALTLLFALPLGLVIAFGSMSKWAPFSRLAKSSPGLAAFRPISALTNIIVWIIRGTPLMLQLIIIYYGPGLWFGQNIWGAKRLLACTVAFVINYACYFSVIYRGGIEGVPQGQREAGEVLGMTKTQIFFKVTLLQMIKRIVPPMSNEIITLVKDTSHRHHRAYQGGRSVHEVRRHHMAAVLHRRLLPAVCRRTHAAVQLH